jgi:hypothetical protein
MFLVKKVFSQDIPYVCPECNEILKKNNIVCICEYPISLPRGLMNKGKAHKFECPKCFSISYLHVK